MLPAGRYFVGDPCYVAEELGEDWGDFCKFMLPRGSAHFGGCLDGEYQLPSGRLFAAHGTMYGDGGYDGSDGFNYSVDAGLIGCVQLREGETFNRTNLGTIVEFPEHFKTWGDAEGNIQIGHIRIVTGE